MINEIIMVKRPATVGECESMRKCWNCAIYLNAAAGEDFFDCFDTPKMAKCALEFCNCF